MTNVAAAVVHLKEAIALLEAVASEESPAPTSHRVETVGRIAHLHLKFIEEHGSMTVHDSREIRRALVPNASKMRSTANLFGTKDSGAILYRVVKYGTRVKNGQTVRLTDEGLRVASLYREAHPQEGA